MTDLSGKTALVTGSTSGIGQATAIALAARGAHVLIVGRNEQRAKDVVAEIEGSGGSASFKLTTLSDLQSAQELVEWAIARTIRHVCTRSGEWRHFDVLRVSCVYVRVANMHSSTAHVAPRSEDVSPCQVNDSVRMSMKRHRS